MDETTDAEVERLRLLEAGDPAELILDLPAVTSSVPVARHEVVDALLSAGLGSVADTAALVCSELLTNAVKASSATVRLTLTIQLSGMVRIAVEDDNPRTPGLHHEMPPADAEGGRGLPIIEALSDEWGVDVGDTGKSVWCVLVAPGFSA